MKKGKVICVTRGDVNGTYGNYTTWSKEPTYEERYKAWCGTVSSSHILDFCPEHFEKITGIKLKGGPKSIIKGRFCFERVK